MTEDVTHFGRVLITGGSGFIGTNLVEYLSELGAPVLNVDIVPPQAPDHQRHWVNVDVRDGDACRRVIHDFSPALVLHLAARTDLNGGSVTDYSSNTDGVKALMDAAKGSRGLRSVLFASSRLVCRTGYIPRDETDVCPDTAYGESKVIGEQIVRSGGQKLGYSWILVRPTSIWGPWFGVPYDGFFRAVLKGQYVHPRGLRIKKSFGFVGNAVFQLLRLAGESGGRLSGQTVHLCDYRPIEVSEWAEMILKESTTGGRVREVPRILLSALARIGDGLKLVGMREPPLTSVRLHNLMTPMVYDTDELESACGLLPYSTREGVRLTLD